MLAALSVLSHRDTKFEQNYVFFNILFPTLPLTKAHNIFAYFNCHPKVEKVHYRRICIRNARFIIEALV